MDSLRPFSNRSRNERVDLPAKRPLREKWNSRNALRERNRSRHDVDLALSIRKRG